MLRQCLTGARHFIIGAVIGLGPTAALAQETAGSGAIGVTDERIVFGQSAALKGPTARLGQGMRQGLLAAFQEANDAGGVHGRTLELISLDDGYEPEAAARNTTKLLEDERVFALIGAVGTPTSKAAQPIATEAGAPFIGAFTGAAFLRDPELDRVINVRASYRAEAEVWVEHLVEDLGADKIGLFYQNDSFGQAGRNALAQALADRGLSVVAEGTYERNTNEVKKAVLAIRKARPEAVVMVGAYSPVARFVQTARMVAMKQPLVTISFVGASAFAEAVGPVGQDTVMTQVMPNPEDSELPIIADYQKALRAHDPEAQPGYVSLEGYVVGRLAIAALERAGADLNREAFLSAVFDGEPFALGGLTLAYGPEDNQGLDDIFLTVLRMDGSYRSLDTLEGLARTPSVN